VTNCFSNLLGPCGRGEEYKLAATERYTGDLLHSGNGLTMEGKGITSGGRYLGWAAADKRHGAEVRGVIYGIRIAWSWEVNQDDKERESGR